MEFRNHQEWVKHRYRAIAARGPFSTFLFLLGFVLILLPVLAIAFLGVAIFLILLPIRILLAQVFGGPRSGTSGHDMTPRPTPTGDNDSTASSPRDQVIDVEVTHSRTNP